MDEDRTGERMIGGDNDDEAESDQDGQHPGHRNLRQQVLAAEEQGEGDSQKRADEQREPDDAGDQPGGEMEPHPPRRRDIVELPEDLRHVGGVSRAGPVERDRRLIEVVERMGRLDAFPFAGHVRPFLVDDRRQIGSQRFSQRSGLGLRAHGVAGERRGRARFLGDRVFRIAELVPAQSPRMPGARRK